MNNLLRIISSPKRLWLLALSLFLIAPYSSIHAVKADKADETAQLSPDDIKMLEELDREVKRYVSTLPTEAQLRAQGKSEAEIAKSETQEKFAKDVETYSKMSEEDLLELMEVEFKKLAETQNTELPPANIIQNEDERKPVIAPVELPKPAAPSNKQLAAIAVIDDLIKSIDKFLRKADVMNELPRKIPAWIKEGKLRSWPTALTWNVFKGQIEDLQIKLNKIKDKDPKTSAYKYLDDLIKDESAYNNIVKTKEALFKSEPQIELGSFGIDKMTTKSRDAIRNALTTLNDAISSLKIPSALDAIIEKYDPTAKKLKEAEEANSKQALEQSKRQRFPGSTTTAGNVPYNDPYGRQPNYDYGLGSTTPSKIDFAKPEPEKDKDTKKELKSAGSETKKGEDDKKDDKKGKREDDKDASKYEENFIGSLDKLVSLIEGNKKLEKLEDHYKDASYADTALVDRVIPQAVEKATEAANSGKRFKQRLPKLGEQQRREYRTSIQNAYREGVKEQVDRMIEQINRIEKPSSIFVMPTAVQQNMAKTKGYLYLGQAARQGELQKVVDDARKNLVPGTQLTGDAKQIETLLNKYPSAPDLTLIDLRDKLNEVRRLMTEI